MQPMQGARRIIAQRPSGRATISTAWTRSMVPRSIQIMNVKRTATLVVVGLPAAAWLYAAATSGVHRDLAMPIERASRIDASSDALAAEIARLHERLRPDASPRQPGRNLFAFTARGVRSEALPPKPALSEAVVAPVAAPPPFKLIGVAEDAGPDGPVRTAIVSAPGQVFLVKQGENLTLRYRVAKISPDVVELTDLGDGSTLRLALR